MLSHESNQRLCRVGPDDAMGHAMRRYWLPFMSAADLSIGDDPRGVELMGERFVAWRDDSGRAGLFHQSCLHRGAAMQLARAEGDGLRCIYHGWKFAVDGTVLDTPNVADPKFKERIKGRAYPAREAGGLLWAYLGPHEREPEFPHWPWMDLPDAKRLITRHVEECSFVQVIEGLVDSSHLGLLHMNGLQQSGSTDLDFAHKVSSMQRNLAPRLDVQDTDFGFYYAALREIDDDQGPRTEARVAAFVAPCCVLNPNGDIATFVVPLDDGRTSFVHVFWSETQALNREPLRSRHLEFIGLTPEVLDGFGLTDDTLGRADRPNPRNNFHQDREAMRAGKSWSGLPGLIEEDVAASVSAGPLRDRSLEMLSSADVGITRLYRTLLACADAVEQDKPPLGIERGVDWSQVRGRHGVLTSDDWRELIAPRHEPETEGSV
ncbi:MAG: (2Fe-2S)-binding protein [Comamonadaceae bacterium]|nr:MAG: (2Fe-2S)-binding protein [Comamonadaceae bacterium]